MILGIKLFTNTKNRDKSPEPKPFTTVGAPIGTSSGADSFKKIFNAKEFAANFNSGEFNTLAEKKKEAVVAQLNSLRKDASLNKDRRNAMQNTYDIAKNILKDSMIKNAQDSYEKLSTTSVGTDITSLSKAELKDTLKQARKSKDKELVSDIKKLKSTRKWGLGKKHKQKIAQFEENMRNAREAKLAELTANYKNAEGNVIGTFQDIRNMEKRTIKVIKKAAAPVAQKGKEVVDETVKATKKFGTTGKVIAGIVALGTGIGGFFAYKHFKKTGEQPIEEKPIEEKPQILQNK